MINNRKGAGMKGTAMRPWLLAAVLGALSLNAQAESATINVQDADLATLIKLISDKTGRSFVVDPRVQGKATILTSKPMSKDELYNVFLSVLEVQGFAAVPDGAIVKIVPNANAKFISGVAGRGKGGDDLYSTRVVQVSHVSAAQLVPILRPLIPPEGHLAAHTESNTLIVSAPGGTIDRLMAIIKRVDQSTSGEIEILPLRHAAASELVRVLNSLQQGGAPKDAAQAASKPVLVADDRSNSILIGGEKAERLQLRAIITQLDTPTEMIGNTHVIYLRYAKAEDMAKVLSGIAESQAKVEKAKEGAAVATAQAQAYQIQADASANAVVITAAPEIFRSLQSVVQKLDVRRAQVQVEAVIAEVSADKAAELGVQWLFDGSQGGVGPVGAVTYSGTRGGNLLQLGALASTAARTDSSASSAALGTALGNLEGALVGVGRFNSSGLNFATLIRALDGNSDTNVLSTPSVVTLDNEQAEIVVGQTVPFITGSFSSTSTAGAMAVSNPFQTIKRENVGISLKVTPQINEGNSVKLTIEQKVDSLSAVAGAVDLTTNTRSIKTTVLVDDGKMIVLGGLIKDNVTESVKKIPWLGDLPLLGWLFSHKSTQKTKTNLMVFLKPTILRDVENSTAVTEGKYSYIRARQLEQVQRGIRLMGDEHMPVLPEPPAMPGSESPVAPAQEQSRPVE